MASICTTDRVSRRPGVGAGLASRSSGPDPGCERQRMPGLEAQAAGRERWPEAALQGRARSIRRHARWTALSEVLDRHFHEHGRRSDDRATVWLGCTGSDEQLAPFAPDDIGLESVLRSDEYRCQILDRQLAGDGRASFEEKQATVKVIDNGGDCAAMDNARCAYVTIVERVQSLHTIPVPQGPEVVPMGIVRAAPQAVVVVSREFSPVRVDGELLRPHGQQRLHVSHEDRPGGAAPRQPRLRSAVHGNEERADR